MIEKYVPMVREALEEIKPHYENLKEYEDVLINAKLYIDDAENFLKEGKKRICSTKHRLCRWPS